MLILSKLALGDFLVSKALSDNILCIRHQFDKKYQRILISSFTSPIRYFSYEGYQVNESWKWIPFHNICPCASNSISFNIQRTSLYKDTDNIYKFDMTDGHI